MNLFKRPKYLLVILLASLSFVTFAPQPARAIPPGSGSVQATIDEINAGKPTGATPPATTANAGNELVNWLAIQLGHVVYFFTIKLPSIILMQEIKLFTSIGTYNNFTGEEQVVKAWSTVRDLANMFFILILLLMSFGTILQIPGYGYRQLLSRLLLMAILINFSKSIVAILIDFSQIITLTFLAPVFSNIGGNLEAALGLSKIMQLPSNPDTSDNATYTGVSFLMAMIMGGIMMIVTTVIMGVILAMFLMRVVAFWIMVILSPMAYLAKAFPKTTQYYSQWENELSKNLTLGPGLAFFIWLAFSIVGQGNINSSFNAVDNGSLRVDGLANPDNDGSLLTSVSKAATTANLLNFVVGISLLMAGLKFAAASGAAGASMAGKASGSLQKWGSRIGRGATVGAALGAGALAWRGTSGEGGVKGGLAWSKSVAGKGLVKTGEAFGSGLATRAGLKMQTTDVARRQRKQTKFEKQFENMTDDQAQQFNESIKSGVGFLGKREARAYLAKRDLEGKTKLTVGRAQQMEREFQAAGDQKSLERLRSRHMAVATPWSLAKQITEKGLSSVSGMDSTGMKPEHLREILKQDPKAIATMLEAKDKSDRDNFMAILDGHIASGSLGGTFADEATDLGKARLLQGKFDSDKVHTDFAAASKADQVRYANNLARATKAEDLVKINDKSSDLFEQVALAVAAADPSKANEMYSKAKNEEQREMIVNSHVSVGNIQNVINNSAIDKNLISEDKIIKHFDSKITAAMGLGASRFDASSQLARRTPNLAHLAFYDPSTRSTNYANFARYAKSLRFDELLKIETAELKRLISIGGLTPEQITLLRDRQGIT